MRPQPSEIPSYFERYIKLVKHENVLGAMVDTKNACLELIRSIDASLENYSYASVGHLADLGEMAGLFKYFLHTYKSTPVNCYVIAPASVKKRLTGSGKGDKTLVREALRHYIEDYDSIEWNSLDESDACAVGIAHFLTMLEVCEDE